MLIGWRCRLRERLDERANVSELRARSTARLLTSELKARG
jgi:hypothetical protein